MKIKFIKPFRLYNPIGDDMMMDEGTIENMEKEDYAQWLIDNGFAKEVKEPGGWKPNYGDKYYTIRSNGECEPYFWREDIYDKCFQAVGNAFKTKESAKRYVDYLKAVETVSHDEGFMKISRKVNYSPCGYGVYRGFGKSIIAEVSDTTVSAGEFYFDTHEHAKASVEAHQPEWQTILNYDWGKGEDNDEN